MKQKLILAIKKDPLLFAGLFFTFFFGLTLILFFFYPFTNLNLWKGYYTVFLCEEQNPVIDPVQCKRELHLKSLIMEQTETVAFSSFNKMEEIHIKNINDRLDSLDPRIDPYMLEKGSYFHPDDQTRILYMASYLHPLLFFIKASIFFSKYGYEYKIPDVDIIEILIIFCSGVAFVVIFLFLYKKESKERIAGIIGALPWIPGLISGDIMSVIYLFLLYPVWFFLFEEIFIWFKNRVIFGWNKFKKSTIIIRAIHLFLFLLISIFLSFLQDTSSFFFLLSFFASLFFIACYCLFYYYQNRSKKHQLFEAIPIRLFFKGKYLFARVNKLPFLLFIGLVIILFSIYYFYRYPSAIFVDKIKAIYPELEMVKRKLVLRELEEIWNNKSSRYLPDLSDYVAHISYQEGLLFGSTYTFPSYVDGFIISYFDKDPFTGKIMKKRHIIKEYNKTWFKNLMVHIPVDSVEYMLVNQKNAVKVSARPVGTYYQCRYPKIHISLIFFVSLIILFFFDFYLTPSVLYDTKRFAIKRWSKAA